MLLEISREVTPERMKRQSQKKQNKTKQHPAVHVTGDGSKSNVIKSNIVQEPGILDPWIKANSVQFSHSVVSDSLRPMNHSTPGLPVHHQFPEFSKTHIIWVGDVINHLVLCNPLLLLPSILPRIRVFSYESVLHIRWPKYWRFSFSHQSFQWIFRTDFL